MPVNTAHITECARLIRNADPRLYEKFVRLLDAYAYEITVAVTNAPADAILVTQGRAQQAQKFLRLLTELDEPTRPTP